MDYLEQSEDSLFNRDDRGTLAVRTPKIELLDVSLSRCFGDAIEKQDLEVVNRIASIPGYDDGHLRLVKWYDSMDLRLKLQNVLKEELNLSEGNEAFDFNLRIGAKDFSGYQYF